MKTKDILIIFLTIITFLILIIFITPQEDINGIKKLNIITILFLIFIFIFDLLLRVIRWYILLLSQDYTVPIAALVYPLFASSFLNLILPGRIGEAIRLQTLKDDYNIPYKDGLAVIIVEQVINLMGLILVSSISLGLIILTKINVRYEIINLFLPYIFFVFLIIIIGILLLFVINLEKIIPLTLIFPQKINSKLIKFINTFSYGLKNIKQKPYIFWLSLGCSILIWILEGIIIWSLSRPLISNNFEFLIALFASNIANFNFIIPILPGAAGSYEVFLAFILSLSLQYSGKNAILIGIIDRAIKTGVLAILGIHSIIKLGFNSIFSMNKRKENIKILENPIESFSE